MKWIKRHHSKLWLAIGGVVIVVSLWPKIIETDVQAHSLIKEYLDPEQVVVVEQKIQSKPEEPHTVEAQKIPIFVYHSVRPHIYGESKLRDAYDITPELFEQQLTYLQQNGYHVITPKDFFVDEKTGNVVTNVVAPVVLTFDDGWKTQYEYAYPLLKKYNTKAVFYIYTGPIGAPSFLNWEEIIDMQKNGMIIGSHTLTHPLLKNLSDQALHNELFTSKKILEKHLRVPVDDFATPYGYSDDHVVAVAKEAGYRTVRTLYKGSYHKDLFSLKGYLVSDSLDDFIGILNKKD